MKQGKKFWNFKALDQGGADLYLYGPISSTTWWGDEVTPKQFKADLDALGDVENINVYINSDGGDVFAGQAINSMLKRHNAKITVHIDGLAASIASVIAMAGDEIIMPTNAMMMIHNPWTFTYGNAADFRKMADDLDKIGESIIAAYKEKTGLKDEEIKKIMDSETWLTADECVEKGFADKIEESKQVAAALDDGFLMLNGIKMDLSRFEKAPKFITASKPEKVEDKPEPDYRLKQNLYEKIGGI